MLRINSLRRRRKALRRILNRRSLILRQATISHNPPQLCRKQKVNIQVEKLEDLELVHLAAAVTAVDTPSHKSIRFLKPKWSKKERLT